MCVYHYIQVKCINGMFEYTQSCRNRSLHYRRTNLLPLHRARVETSKIDEFRVDVRFGTQSPYTRNAMLFVTILPFKKKRKNSTSFVNICVLQAVWELYDNFLDNVPHHLAQHLLALLAQLSKYPTCFKQNTNVVETSLWDLKCSYTYDSYVFANIIS